MDKRKSSPAAVIGVVLVVCLIVLPILYVLSWGPAVWLVNHGYISQDVYSFYCDPLYSLCRVCPPFSAFNDWYSAFFK